jgi:hypothetical protein
MSSVASARGVPRIVVLLTADFTVLSSVSAHVLAVDPGVGPFHPNAQRQAGFPIQEKSCRFRISASRFSPSGRVSLEQSFYQVVPYPEISR